MTNNSNNNNNNNNDNTDESLQNELKLNSILCNYSTLQNKINIYHKTKYDVITTDIDDVKVKKADVEDYDKVEELLDLLVLEYEDQAGAIMKVLELIIPDDIDFAIGLENGKKKNVDVGLKRRESLQSGSISLNNLFVSRQFEQGLINEDVFSSVKHTMDIGNNSFPSASSSFFSYEFPKSLEHLSSSSSSTIKSNTPQKHKEHKTKQKLIKNRDTIFNMFKQGPLITNKSEEEKKDSISPKHNRINTNR